MSDQPRPAAEMCHLRFHCTATRPEAVQQGACQPLSCSLCSFGCRPGLECGFSGFQFYSSLDKKRDSSSDSIRCSQTVGDINGHFLRAFCSASRASSAAFKAAAASARPPVHTTDLMSFQAFRQSACPCPGLVSSQRPAKWHRLITSKIESGQKA